MVSKYFMRQEERTLANKYTYTFEDIIIDPHDERVKVGEKYFFYNNPTLAVESANGSDIESFELIKVTSGTCPFVYNFRDYMEGASCCIIKDKEKESQVEYVPFNLDNEDDRNCLRDKWIRRKSGEYEVPINNFGLHDSRWRTSGLLGSELFEFFTFLDGSPVGKKIENQEN